MASHDQERALARVESFARLMDSQFRFPGTNFRFGLEPILGLVPGGGDVIGFLASSGLVLTMAKHGASPQLVVRMLLNVLLDATIGSIPLLGDIFDATFKANNRNVELLRRHYQQGRYRGSAWPVILVALTGLLLIGGLVVWAIWWLWTQLYPLFTIGG